MKEQYRQGDILFTKVEGKAVNHDISNQVERDERGRIVVAEGEATGHAHAIRDKQATMYRDPVLNRVWVVADEPVKVVHEEHGTIELDSGVWQVTYQRQYVRGEVRRVRD